MQLLLNNISMKHSISAKNEVRQLRSKGLSLNAISTKTQIPKTTIRSWIKDIKLSISQLNALKESTQKALQGGRIKKQALQKEARNKKQMELNNRAIIEIGRMTKRDIFITGVALYWAEGFKNKHEHRLGFCNSDSEMIKLYITWLKEILNIKNEDLIARLTLNESYKGKSNEIENYWSSRIGIPLFQFTKTFYQKTKWKKQYYNDNYHGVLRVHVKNSLDYLFLVRGWIEGMKLNVVK